MSLKKLFNKPIASLHWKNLIFTPTWGMTLLTILFLILFLALGHWQLQRAAEKKGLLQQYQIRAQLAPVNLSTILKSDFNRLQYTRVHIQGYYDNTHSFLLDNKMHQHQVGYQVITPLIIRDGSIILINRGWIARGLDRKVLPNITAVSKLQEIKGLIYAPSGKTLVLDKTIENQHWPRIIQAIDIPQMEHELKKPIKPWLLLLSSEEPNGFVRDWQPDVSPTKHQGYALQWFTFAGILLAIWLGTHLRRR